MAVQETLEWFPSFQKPSGKMEDIVSVYNFESFDSDLQWWVVHLKSHQERKISKDLRSADVPYFLPMVDRHRKIKNRRMLTKVPLFPGYLFFGGGQTERRAVLHTGRTARIIAVDNQAQLKHELGQVLQAIHSGLKIDPYKALQTGTLCRIVSGPGMGLTGKVMKRRGLCKVILDVETIGQSITIEVDAEDVERL
ncbi:MAG: transcription termination/antitermination protein NusG [bacterium]